MEDNNLKLPVDLEQFEPTNPIRLNRGEKLIITRRGNQTIYEIVESNNDNFGSFFVIFVILMGILALLFKSNF